MPAFRLGLLGGTFDPPHLGHLVVAQEAFERLSLDQLIFLVAGIPPHKVGVVTSPPEIRMEMTRAAAAGNPGFQVSGVELNRQGPSYTVDTLRQYRKAHPEADLFFILGADQLAEFHEWQDPPGIAELATLVAVGRDGVEPSEVSPTSVLPGFEFDFVSLPVPRIDISSSDIRARCREDRPIRYLVPDNVRKIIETHGLYRSI
ncbi:MAG: nicotinate-nucleotide adenylyltransferase [Gemmatimonadota bacterium]